MEFGSDIDIDDLHHGINLAESYLQTSKGMTRKQILTHAKAEPEAKDLIFSRRPGSFNWNQQPQQQSLVSQPAVDLGATAPSDEDSLDGIDVTNQQHANNNNSSYDEINDESADESSAMLFYASDIPQTHGIMTPNSARSQASVMGDSIKFSASDPIDRLDRFQVGRSISTADGNRPASASAIARNASRLSSTTKPTLRPQTPQTTRASRAESVNRSVSSKTAQTQSHSSPAAKPTATKRTKEEILRHVENMTNVHERKLQLREKQKADIERLELAQCTFKPAISKGAEMILRSKQEMEYAHMHEAAAREAVMNPKAIYNYKSHANQPHDLEEDVVERLTKKAKEKEEMRRIAEKVLRQEAMADCTFQPMINQSTSAAFDESMDYKPIHERIGELQRDKIVKINKLREDVDASKVDLTFAPAIDPASKKLAAQRFNKLAGYNQSTLDDSTSTARSRKVSDTDESMIRASATDIGTRLQLEGKLIDAHKRNLALERESEIASTMEPAKISQQTRKMAKANPVLAAGFEERQQILQQQAKDKFKQTQQDIEKQGDSWFKPKISDKAANIKTKETAKERANRMSIEAVKDKERKIEAKSHELYSQFTFQPQIDPISKSCGHQPNIDELVDNPRGKRAMEDLRKKAEEKMGEEYTFKPTINNYVAPGSVSDQNYANNHKVHKWQEENACGFHHFHDSDLDHMDRVQGHGGGEIQPTINMKMPEKMAREIRLRELEKEEKRRQELLSREIEEMRECTFQPQTNSYVRLAAARQAYQKPVVVRGLGRHMELQHMICKKKEDEIKREKEAFQVKNASKYRRPEDGTTIVKEFQFSESRRVKRQ